MSIQVWSPKDAQQLKELREAAQIDISILARMYSLSITQIKQLEDGGESSFYSPAIKYATGRKLLMHFGVDITEIKEKGVKKQEFASLNNPKNIFIQKNKHSITLIENKFGCSIFIKFINRYIVIQGLFSDDILELSQTNNYISRIINDNINKIKCINVDFVRIAAGI